MRAKEYKEKFIHLMAEGATTDEAVLAIAASFFEEYNTMVKDRKGSGVVVYNALREQNDKWNAFARSLPNYVIRKDGFIEVLQKIKPELYGAYIRMGRLVKEMKRSGDQNGKT